MVKLMGKSPKKLAPRKGITLIFGAAGTGKTYEVCKAPYSYFFDTEGGARNAQYRDLLIKGGGAYLGPEDGSNDIEFDPVSSCMIAEADGGAFVQAWVWVCQEDLEEQSC